MIIALAWLGAGSSACRTSDSPRLPSATQAPALDTTGAGGSAWHADADESRSGAPVSVPANESRAPEGVQATEAAAHPDLPPTQQSAALVHAPPAVEVLDDAGPGDGPLRIRRGEGLPPIVIPRDEQLFYSVSINLGVLGSLTVGKVVLSSGVEAYVPGLPPPGEPPPVASGREVGSIHSLASGYYLGYRLVHNLDVRLLPQDWPKLYYRDTQNGTENHRAELKIGQRQGESIATYTGDQHCPGCNNPEHFVKAGFLWQKLEHCHRCKLAEHRVWKGPATRTVPPGSVDLLSAVFLARTMVQDGHSEIVFPVVNEQKLWSLTVKAGKHKRISTPAGEFACVLITLATSVPAGEPYNAKSFAGLFGIRGDIRIWMDAKTGVPVVIQGDLPVPVIGKLEVDVELEKYSGTPAEFAPAR
jgi:hypothetical protein